MLQQKWHCCAKPGKFLLCLRELLSLHFISVPDLTYPETDPHHFFCTIPFLLYLFPLSLTRLIHILQKSFCKDTYFNAYRVQCFAIFRIEKSDCLLSKVILLHCPIRFTKWVNLPVVENVTKRWYNLRAGVYFCNIKYKIIKKIQIYIRYRILSSTVNTTKMT